MTKIIRISQFIVHICICRAGGIKERMYTARTGYRQQQDAEISALRADNARLQAELTCLCALLKEKGIEI